MKHYYSTKGDTMRACMFRSILFPDPGVYSLSPAAPQCFTDLNLDWLLNPLFYSGRAELELFSYFFTPLRSAAGWHEDISRH